MSRYNICPLTPALVRLLQSCVDLCTADTKTLARYLRVSPKTINTEFQRICSLLNVPSRTAALLTALSEGWIAFSKSSQTTAPWALSDFSVFTSSDAESYTEAVASPKAATDQTPKKEVSSMEVACETARRKEVFTPFVMLWAEEVPAERVYGSRSVFSEAPSGAQVYPSDTDFEKDEHTGMVETSFTYTF